jgi:signal transduction histidine kinase
MRFPEEETTSESPYRARVIIEVAFLLPVCAALYVASRYSYLLFHSLAELFSIVIACGAFMISWNSRDSDRVNPLTFLGIGYLFIALIDLAHTLTYRGMSIFSLSSDYPTQLWIAARYLQSITLVLFAVLRRSRWRPSYRPVFGIYGAVTLLLLLSIFSWKVFPVCFIEGEELTLFKKISEYIISGVLASAFLIHWFSQGLSEDVRRPLALAIILTIASELSFTFYVSSYGLSNLVGHYLKILAFYFVYKALIASQIRRRLRLIQELSEARVASSKSERELRKANAAKDKFISILAHDLRSPFSGIQTLAELVAQRYDGLDAELRKKYCHMIFEGSTQGLHLLDQLLDWAKTQTGSMEWKPKLFRIQAVLDNEIELARGSAQSKRIELYSQIPEDDEVFADQQMISVVVRNLLANSIKFTPDGGSITTSTRLCETHVEIAVTDTGIGIAQDDLDRLFRIDVHHSTLGTNAEHGNGLGLLLCKEFVERNDGRIEVESVAGKGSTFKFTIPRAIRAGANLI